MEFLINRYFENFPIVTHSNNQVVDITKRVKVLDKVATNPYAFYPFEITNGERPDQLSSRYYKDPFKSWILYLSNKMTDPYHEWYMEQKEFDGFVQKKYGDLFFARLKIKHYRNDYLAMEDIAPSQYNVLGQELQKYWEPVYTANKITSYTRRKTDWITNTNKVVSYTVNTANTFVVDEICDIVYDYYNKGKAQVLNYIGNTVYMQHVSGQYFDSNTAVITSNSYIVGLESGTNTVFTEFNWVANSIPADELQYWKGLTYYEYEEEKNEFNKTVAVLDNSYASKISEELKTLLEG